MGDSVCVRCGASYNWKVWNQKVCDDCRPEYRRETEKVRQKQLAAERRTTYTVVCGICEREFETVKSNVIYCSGDCRHEAQKLRLKKFYADNPGYDKSSHNVERQKELKWSSWIRQKYGLTIDDYNQLVESCDSKCQICGIESDLVIDHCHSTGEVRGLLCRKHNLALGGFQDSVEMLENALKYLKKD